ncbi:MAG: helix-turn-helix transcriptional regulator [Pseudomonadota bacterium]
MTLEKQFGKNVRQWRKARNLSQEDLAARAELHSTYVSGIETGARNPTLRVVERIAAALDVEAAVLLANQ